MFDACRPKGRLFYFLAMLMTLSTVDLGMPVPAPQGSPALTTVSDTVYRADGSPAQGTLLISWPAFITANGSAIAAGTKSVTLGSQGALSVQLTPTTGSNPAGIYYVVVYQLSDLVKTEYWSIPASSPATLSEVRTTPGSGTAAQPVSMQYVNTALASKANDSSVVHLSGSETISGSKPGTDKKDAVMSFVEAALSMTDAIANKDIVDQEKFKEGIGKLIDGAVECLNASAWAKEK